MPSFSYPDDGDLHPLKTKHPSLKHSLKMKRKSESAFDDYLTPKRSSQRTFDDSSSSCLTVPRREINQSLSRSTFAGSLFHVIQPQKSSYNVVRQLKKNTKLKCGLTCSRNEYFTVPPLDKIDNYLNNDGSCIIKGFTIGRLGYGSVYFPDSMDVSNINVDELVFIHHGEIIIYPCNVNKPPLNQGLNKRAQVTLHHVYPKDADNKILSNFEDAVKTNFISKLKEINIQQNTRFIQYRPNTGSWVFEVYHFSRYGFQEDSYNSESDVKLKSDKKQKQLDKHLYNGIQDHTSKEWISHYVESSVDVTSMLVKAYQDELYLQRDVEPMRSAFYGSSESLMTLQLNVSEDYDYSNALDINNDSIFTTQSASPKIMHQYHRPKISVLLNIGGKVPPEESLLTRIKSDCDLGIFKGRSFKCGFSKGFKHYTLSSEIYTGRFASSIVNLKDVCQESDARDLTWTFLTDALDIVHAEAKCTFNSNEIPTYTIKRGKSYLTKQIDLFRKMLNKSAGDEHAKYLCSIWELCYALWGPLNNPNDLRRDYLSSWLRNAVDKPVIESFLLTRGEYLSFSQVTGAVLELISQNKVNDAAQLLMTNNFPQLSILVSQLNSTEYCKAFIKEQVVYWYHSLAEEYLTPEMRKLYLLLSGNGFFQGTNVCEDLDWKRTFGMHLWYQAAEHNPIHEAVRIYREAFESDEAYAVKPLSIFSLQNESCKTYDILYHIMLLYCERVYVLNHVLDPTTYCRDPLDYSMSWILLQLFRSLEVGVIDDMSETVISVSFADQLENMNLWEYAVFVLLFIKNESIKKKHVVQILERNLPHEVTEETAKVITMLIKKIKVPSKWIYEVLAWKSKLSKQFWNCYTYFAYAGDFYKSNDTFVTYLLPPLVLNEQFDQLKLAIKPLHCYSEKIVSWCNEIGLALDFFEVDKHFDVYRERQQKSQRELLNLYKELLQLVQRFPNFPVKTSSQKASIGEISKKCAHLQRFLVENIEDPLFIHNFKYILSNLVMPPDYTIMESLYYLQKFLEYPSYE